MKIISTLSLLLIGLAANAQYTFNEIEIWSGSFPGTPRYFEEVNGTLFFEAYNNYNYELWKSNGTQPGTSMVADLNGTASSGPKSLKEFNGELFFTATVSGYGNELWKSNGTSAGTMLLKDVRSGSSSGFESTTSTFNGTRETFLEFGGELFFFGNTGNGIELWKSDGTSTGTVSVKNFTQGPVYGNGKYSSNAEREKLGVIFNNELYFIVVKSSPILVNYQGELWKTDGTTAGTVLVQDSLHASVSGLTVAGSKIYFVNQTTTTGRELWSSTGTITALESDISAGSVNSDPEYLTAYNGDLYFKAKGPDGRELYKTDGSFTTLIKDIFPGNGSTTANSGLGLARFFEYNGLLYFLAEDATSGGDNELWKTDGTTLGTVKALILPQVGGYIEFLNPTIYDNKIFYRTSGQLWATDGTPANTQQLTDNGNSAEPISQVSHLALFQQNLWFAGANATNGGEAWYIGNQPPTTIDIISCSSYTVPSGDESYSISGTYTDTLTNTQGSDSILVINLTLNQSTTATINVETCDFYTSPSGNNTWSTSGTYMDTLTNSVGCDSIITINMSVMTSFNTVDENSCGDYVSPSGNYTWTTSGLYADTLTNAAGCDSIITINLSVLSSSSSISDNTCDLYTSPSGNYTWSSSGTYFDTIPNGAGCDSVITINLTVDVVDISVQTNMGTLEANTSNANYQWLDCDNNYAAIPGETNQSFTPQITGLYAVRITEGDCTDTSDCFQVDVWGLQQLSESTILVYPNPTQDRITIQNVDFKNVDQIAISNGLGQIVYLGAVEGIETSVKLPESAGLYFLKYKGDSGEFHSRIVRN
ncbi:MAG: T9SS type A sorting domain-containing protein [Crocinitomicaceae bacterium]|nr:T9SS type A sorting domain-containing protein [Crocinitomicaceae bacterium]